MGIKLPTVSNFLCCLTLETGGLVLGWLSAIFSVIAIISTVAILIAAGVAYNNETNKDNLTGTFIGNLGLDEIIDLY